MHKNPANEPNRQQKVAKIVKNYKNMRKKAPKLNLFRKLFQYGIIIVQKNHEHLPWKISLTLKSVPARAMCCALLYLVSLYNIWVMIVTEIQKSIQRLSGG